MELSVFLAVLAAALMHAGWNTMVRSRLDRFSSVLLLTIVCAVLALGLMPFFAVPARAVPVFNKETTISIASATACTSRSRRAS